jgi:molecular chaperone GrpE
MDTMTEPHEKDNSEATPSERQAESQEAENSANVEFLHQIEEIQLKDERIAKLERELKAYEVRTEAARDYLKKLEQELKDIQARNIRDRELQLHQEVSKILLPFLEVQDDLNQASSLTATPVESILQGLDLIARKLERKLEELGVSRLVAKGEIFDPNQHEAITSVAVEKDDQDGQVVEEFQPGFVWRDKLLRPAKVVVGKKFEN